MYENKIYLFMLFGFQICTNVNSFRTFHIGIIFVRIFKTCTLFEKHEKPHGSPNILASIIKC